MQHVEFFHQDHFEHKYHCKKAKKSLAHFIAFFWETDFEQLWEQYPTGLKLTLPTVLFEWSLLVARVLKVY